MNRAINKNKRYNKVLQSRRMPWLLASLLIALVLISVFFIAKTVTAERNSARTKTITSVEIQQGDTLWNIAKAHMTDEYNDINDYIEEIMFSNSLSSDRIHAGNHIIVPYYIDAVR
ncbi:MAG TPA: LysM peptidoglycan-binding domain-containing protein [Clostridiales bacterium]|nr:LysM peptidoglycan-binding domain-containing protein [Clostridiales bacterium]